MQDMEDKDLETLFHQTRASDQRSATSFDRDWEAARSRLVPGRRASLRNAIAAASIIVIVIAVAVAVRVAGRRSTIPQQSARSQGLDQAPQGRPPGLTDDTTAARTPPLRGNSDSVSAPGGIGSPKRRVRHQYVRLATHEDRELLSAWRSPTEFLLKSPADDLLKVVPNIQDSMVRIDSK